MLYKKLILHGTDINQGIHLRTARISVATAVATKRSIKVMMNSMAKACPFPTEGTVRLPEIDDRNIILSTKEAHTEPAACASA